METSVPSNYIKITVNNRDVTHATNRDSISEHGACLSVWNDQAHDKNNLNSFDAVFRIPQIEFWCEVYEIKSEIRRR
jgi:uncharacterized protein (UPF0276 family)